MKSNFILSCNNITLNYGQNQIFSNLTHDFKSGEVILLCGNNGSGKSSLLKIISRLITLYDDHSHMYLKAETETEQQAINTKDIFYMGHKQPLKDNLTIFDHLYFHTKDKKLIDESLAYFNLYEYKHTQVKNLSAGQKTKIILSKLYIQRTIKNIWLLDEPFNTIDKTSSDLLIKLIKQAILKNVLVIISSHQIPKNLDVSTTVNMNDYISAHERLEEKL